MKKILSKRFLKLLCLFLLCSIAFKTSASFDFSRNLKLGDYGDDVQELQILLNKDPDTKISTVGVGSPGNETKFFGNKTKEAVKKFQLKYKNQVLIPAGLTYPTGFVGLMTRAKLKDFGTAFYEALNYINPNTNQNQTTASLKPEITSISKNYFANGDTITLTGKNFTASNTIFLNIELPKKFTNIKSTNNGTTLSTTIDLTISDALSESFSELSSSDKEELIENIIEQKTKDAEDKETWYTPATIVVINENGTSNTLSVMVNILAGV